MLHCITDLTICCSTAEDAQEIYNTLCRWRDTPVPGHEDEEIGDYWLGKYLIHSGLVDYKEIDTCGYDTHGTIERIAYEKWDYRVSITLMTEWVPSLRMWTDICNKCWSDKVINILYVADEPGCFLHITNDPVYEEMYYVDISPDNENDIDITGGRYTEDELKKDLMDFFIKKGISVNNDDLNSLRNEIAYFGIDFFIRKYQYRDIEDFD